MRFSKLTVNNTITVKFKNLFYAKKSCMIVRNFHGHPKTKNLHCFYMYMYQSQLFAPFRQSSENEWKRPRNCSCCSYMI